jgi:hypothetical protein
VVVAILPGVHAGIPADAVESLEERTVSATGGQQGKPRDGDSSEDSATHVALTSMEPHWITLKYEPERAMIFLNHAARWSAGKTCWQGRLTLILCKKNKS